MCQKEFIKTITKNKELLMKHPMKARLIATVAGTTTFENATSTLKHIVQIGNTFYSVELGANDDIRKNPIPRKVIVLKPDEILMDTPLIDAFSQANVEVHEESCYKGS